MKRQGRDGSALLDQIREHGMEGVIGKRADSLYESERRSGAWVKIKVIQEQETVIGGYTDPEGSRSHFGSLLIGVYDRKQLYFSGKVGTGFDGKLLIFLKGKLDALTQDECPFVNLPEKRSGRYGQGVTPAEMKRCHWVAPRLVCQVKFHEWTREDCRSRARDDRPPDAIRRATHDHSRLAQRGAPAEPQTIARPETARPVGGGRPDTGGEQPRQGAIS